MKHSGKVAFAGVTCALSVTCMLLTIIPTLEIGLPALAGCLLILPVIELGVRYGFLCYAATAVVSLLLAHSLEAKVLFVVFFGYYPVIKALIERMRSNVWQWVTKFVLFNITVCGMYWVLVNVLAILPKDDFLLFGKYMYGAFVLIANVVFVLYDRAMTSVITAYLRLGQARLRKMFRF